MRIVDFKCPGCGLLCRLNIETKGLKHQLPACPVFEKTTGQDFLKMAKLASAPKDGKIERIN